jgi:hypothetical protein
MIIFHSNEFGMCYAAISSHKFTTIGVSVLLLLLLLLFILIAFWFCTVPSFGPTLSMHLFSGTRIQLLSRLNLKEFKGNLRFHFTPDSLTAYATINMKKF